MVISDFRDGKCYRLLPEKENIEQKNSVNVCRHKEDFGETQIYFSQTAKRLQRALAKIKTQKNPKCTTIPHKVKLVHVMLLCVLHVPNFGLVLLHKLMVLKNKIFGT